jgi:hypothetical protein
MVWENPSCPVKGSCELAIISRQHARGIKPPGLSREWRMYHYEKIREFFPEETRDIVLVQGLVYSVSRQYKAYS